MRRVARCQSYHERGRQLFALKLPISGVGLVPRGN
jgi:hypothetical protein